MAAEGLSATGLWRLCVAEHRAGRLPLADIPDLAAAAAAGLLLQPWLCRACVDSAAAALFYAWRLRPGAAAAAAAGRPDCHWGVNCRTQRHNPGHAERYNHVCPQTRFA
mmetsp:Transcript_54060/g.113002  ORF Transcript_54060/g.113002 Transcript_54060/m.113002 type:complete len:109 (-) Transcript_54060:302-628(-)